jgi:hypothetical protein
MARLINPALTTRLPPRGLPAKQLAEARAKSAGATKIDLHLEEDIKLVPLSSNKDLFIEALIYATAEGRAT